MLMMALMILMALMTLMNLMPLMAGVSAVFGLFRRRLGVGWRAMVHAVHAMAALSRDDGVRFGPRGRRRNGRFLAGAETGQWRYVAGGGDGRVGGVHA